MGGAAVSCRRRHRTAWRAGILLHRWAARRGAWAIDVFPLLRHPAWGRAQETYGEDPCHLGAMGAALGSGIEAHNVCATVKHLALNSMENSRFKVDVTIDERSLHEIYLPHFKTIIDAGVSSVMSAYNQMNGEYCGQNLHLLTDILRGEWGFSGFVHSDWIMGVYQPYGATAGLDIENPEPRVFGERLIAAVEAGNIAPAVIDTACRRILAGLYRIACAEDPLPEYRLAEVAGAAHVALAREAAEKSAVLLANDGALPLPRTIGRLAVLGSLAALANTGDNGSSRVRAPHVVTALAGLVAALGQDRVVASDENDLAAAAAAAESADAVVVVAGYTAAQEGEFIPGDLTLGQEEQLVADGSERKRVPIGGDRLDLGLPADQIALIETAIASGKPVIVVLVAGSAVIVEPWHDRVAAILQTFYSGMEGGSALAALLLGDVSPAGRLPFTVARDAADYPVFDRDAVAVTYDYWHGYARLARDGRAARYAFGHGLSYSRFTTRALKLRQTSGRISGSVAVCNSGDMAADHVVLLWASAPGGVQPRWPRRLVAFARVALAPGETRIVPLSLPLSALDHRDPATHCWQREAGDWRFFLADTAETEAQHSVVISL